MRSRSTLVMLAMMAAGLAIPFPMPRERKLNADNEAIEKARQKRERKAKKRIESKGESK